MGSKWPLRAEATPQCLVPGPHELRQIEHLTGRGRRAQPLVVENEGEAQPPVVENDDAAQPPVVENDGEPQPPVVENDDVAQSPVVENDEQAVPEQIFREPERAASPVAGSAPSTPRGTVAASDQFSDCFSEAAWPLQAGAPPASSPEAGRAAPPPLTLKEVYDRDPGGPATTTVNPCGSPPAPSYLTTMPYQRRNQQLLIHIQESTDIISAAPVIPLPEVDVTSGLPPEAGVWVDTEPPLQHLSSQQQSGVKTPGSR